MATFNRSPIACTAYLGAAVAIAVSAVQNVLNGYALGAASSQLHALTFAAGSAAGAILQPVSWFAAWLAFKRWQIGRGLIALALGTACLAYATLSSLGFVSVARSDASASRVTQSGTYALNKARAETALSELKAMAGAPFKSKKDEARRAERREALETTIAGAAKALDGETKSSRADPQAASLAAYAVAVGLPLSADQISPWINAASVIFFELCAGVSLIVAHVIATVPQKAPRPVERELVDEPSEVEPEAVDAEPAKRGRRRNVLPDDVLERIRAAGGKLDGSLTQIGEVIGVPAKASAHRALKDLEAAGSIRLETGANGTRVAVIN